MNCSPYLQRRQKTCNFVLHPSSSHAMTCPFLTQMGHSQQDYLMSKHLWQKATASIRPLWLCKAAKLPLSQGIQSGVLSPPLLYATCLLNFQIQQNGEKFAPTSGTGVACIEDNQACSQRGSKEERMLGYRTDNPTLSCLSDNDSIVVPHMHKIHTEPDMYKVLAYKAHVENSEPAKLVESSAAGCERLSCSQVCA